MWLYEKLLFFFVYLILNEYGFEFDKCSLMVFFVLIICLNIIYLVRNIDLGIGYFNNVCGLYVFFMDIVV